MESNEKTDVRNCHYYLRFGLKTLLFLGFLAAVACSIFKLHSRETSTSIQSSSENCTLPAITICPEGLETNSTYRKFISGNHKTFWDFSTKIKPLEKYLIKGRPNSFIWNGKNRYGKLENDITVTDFATVNYKNEMVRCMTLTFVNPKMTEDRLALTLTFNLTENITFLQLERHEEGQSRMKYRKDSDGFFYLQRNDSKQELLKVHRRVTLDNCDNDNKQVFEECLDYFILDQLGCYPQWLQNVSSSRRLKACRQSGDVERFIFYSKLFYKENGKQSLVDYGCFNIGNCVRDEWYVKSKDSYAPVGPNLARIVFVFSKSNCMTVSRQILIYGLMDFVSDFGAFLGLLLGASLLSIFDSGIDIGKTVWNGVLK